MPTLAVRGVDYYIHHQDSGMPLLLLHGFTGSHETWLPYANAVHQQGYRMIAPDLLGHGLTEAPSSPERYRMAEVAEDMIVILTQLGIKTCALLGYSMGGRLALYLARYYPQYFTQIILESASPGLATEGGQIARQRKDRILAMYILASGLEAFVEQWESLPMWASQAQLPESLRQAQHMQRLKHTPLGLANSLRGMGTGTQPSLWDDLTMIQHPVQLITGELDTKFHQINIFMQQNLPQATHISILDAGHTVHLEKSTLFWEKVFGFLEKYE